MTTATNITNCRLCHSAKLEKVFDVGASPLGDDFISFAELERKQPSFDVTMMLCGDCGNVQLSQVVNPDAIYKRYTYLTSVSHGLVEHFQRYADDVMQRFKAPGMVVEIGSNEGAMLKHFQKNGWRVLGIDPALEISERAVASGVDTWPVYFSEKVARQARVAYGHADLIVANNVLANIDDIDEVAIGVRSLLNAGGVFVFETSYLLPVVTTALIDTIFHEHVSYFAVHPLRKFFERHSLELFDAERTSPKGGSVRCFVQHSGGNRHISGNVQHLEDIEKLYEIDKPEVYGQMKERLERIRDELQCVCLEAQGDGKHVAAWGASDGGTSMLYYFGLGQYLECLIDDNRAKINTYSPGLHIPVLSSECLSGDNAPDMIILLAWRYAAEIMAAHPEYKGKWVLPLPEVKVI